MTKILPYLFALLAMFVSYTSMVAIFESENKADTPLVNKQDNDVFPFRTGTSKDDCEWVALSSKNPKICWEFEGIQFAPPTAFRINKLSGLHLEDSTCKVYNQLASVESGAKSYNGDAIRWVCPVSINQGA